MPTQHAKVLVRIENTTGATRGEPIARRARPRTAELETAHDLLPSTELERWREQPKHLAEIAPKARRTRG